MRSVIISYNGTKENLKSTINNKALELQKDIIIYDYDIGKIEIGFERLGHSGGRYFVADLVEKNQTIYLKGEFKDIYLKLKSTFLEKIGDVIEVVPFYLTFLVLIYAIILIIPAVIWHFTLKTSYLYILFSIPIPIMALLFLVSVIANKKSNRKKDDEFLLFMTEQVGCAVETGGVL